MLKYKLWPKILYRKTYGDKKGSKSFQQQRKIFCRKCGWLSMKVLQIKVCRLKLFGCSLKLLLNVQCTLNRKRGVLLIPASYFIYLEKKEHKCLKSLQSSFNILHPACVLRSVCSLHLTLSLHFTPGPQSAVCVLHWLIFVRKCNWNQRWELVWTWWPVCLFCSLLLLFITQTFLKYFRCLGFSVGVRQ